jgi:hypothetical protein
MMLYLPSGMETGSGQRDKYIVVRLLKNYSVAWPVPEVLWQVKYEVVLYSVDIYLGTTIHGSVYGLQTTGTTAH